MGNWIGTADQRKFTVYLAYDYLPARQVAELLIHLDRMYDRASGRWQKPRLLSHSLQIDSINTGSSVEFVVGALGLPVLAVPWAVRNVAHAYKEVGEGYRAFAEGRAILAKKDAELEKLQAETRRVEAENRKIAAEARAVTVREEADRLQFARWAELLRDADERMRDAKRRLGTSDERGAILAEIDAIQVIQRTLVEQGPRLGLPAEITPPADALNALITEAIKLTQKLKRSPNIKNATLDGEQIV